MSLKVIGAGFGRTGTLSLKHALERLGLEKCYHMREVREHPEHRAIWTRAHAGEAIDWDVLFDGYQASVDWPSCNLWREQMVQYPEAKVLLSLRDPDSWYESVMNTIYQNNVNNRASHDPERHAAGQWVMDIVWQRLFDDRMDERDHVIGVFNAHNQEVIDSVPQEKLLVFEARQGWAPLCRFLGVEVPDEPYPRVNTKEDALRWVVDRDSRERY